MESLSYAAGVLKVYLVPLVAPLVAVSLASAVLTVVLGAIPVLGHLALSVGLPALSAVFQAVYLPMVLRAHDGKPLELGQLAQLPDNLVDLLVTMVVLGAAVSLGSAFFVIPGLAAMALLGFAPFLVIDRRVGFMDAFTQSIQLGQQNLVQLAIAALVIELASISGAILFGFGLLFTVPLGMLAWAHVYRGFVPLEAAKPTRRGTGRVRPQ